MTEPNPEADWVRVNYWRARAEAAEAEVRRIRGGTLGEPWTTVDEDGNVWRLRVDPHGYLLPVEGNTE